jgi:hypothetical protein
LHIRNVTETNINFNYTLHVTDAEGRKTYSVKLLRANDNNNFLQHDAIMSTSISHRTNSITFSPKHRRKLRPSTFHTTTEHTTAQTIRKLRENTTISIAEMSSIASTTRMTTEMRSKKKQPVVSEATTTNNKTNEKEVNNVTTTEESISEETIDVNRTNLTDTNVVNNMEKFRNFIITTGFTLLCTILVIFLLLLCHYRHQVLVLKTEIIQMNLENYYNQSCLYPTYNAYSSRESIERNGMPFDDIKGQRSEELFDTSSGSNYSNNSHFYQSVDEVESHVYDEILTAINDPLNEGKPNNYENNQCFNCKYFLFCLARFVLNVSMSTMILVC